MRFDRCLVGVVVAAVMLTACGPPDRRYSLITSPSTLSPTVGGLAPVTSPWSLPPLTTTSVGPAPEPTEAGCPFLYRPQAGLDPTTAALVVSCVGGDDLYIANRSGAVLDLRATRGSARFAPPVPAFGEGPVAQAADATLRAAVAQIGLQISNGTILLPHQSVTFTPEWPGLSFRIGVAVDFPATVASYSVLSLADLAAGRFVTLGLQHDTQECAAGVTATWSALSAQGQNRATWQAALSEALPTAPACQRVGHFVFADSAATGEEDASILDRVATAVGDMSFEDLLRYAGELLPTIH